VPASKLQPRIAHQDAGQEPRFGEDLEAVAHAQHIDAARRLAGDLAHHGRARRDGAAAQIVAIGEPARQHDEIDRRDLGFAMPDMSRSRLMRRASSPVTCSSAHHVAVAVDAGEDDDGGFHGSTQASSMS
jgi:hypothetical protein